VIAGPMSAFATPNTGFYNSPQGRGMIAISYRRDDSLPLADRLYDRFGKERVFMDFDSIPYSAGPTQLTFKAFHGN
jgi:hypothetical protein